ncbi:interleukin-6 receptor subunit beta isoform X2 [Equus asinus]|uniref:Interleukin-6 receptor subunit beta n=3 Tax=Equus TaxID=9789 RepID=F7CFP8_HORSE|nr:interleukin-6 receptor subunit beta isoform X2 [Equus caballus]XP_008514091.1 PREDICTED: interleukin-6 receptor subunit beta isoform X1 [Equus przewalskii]XP_008514092.1 PREDICTED: interleukin-6 receptor subunit beta isoform X1 [Equus przewalskii]XP_014715847.1 interleukin-6 receptor subunit beta isoform X2 [Equus asinus]XP_014715848.1 interleukin-6 receptor subunit beta isoform X2 [Equus asinus]XP_046527037.1 interleukin-6 receptor subunit beta isoform X1 [Equus quagga]
MSFGGVKHSFILAIPPVWKYLCKMLTLQTWIVQALFVFLTTESIGGLLDPCGYINPESPVVQLGSNFTAVCVLKEKCMDYFHVNANYIFWKTNHVTVPKEQYTVINRTASSVTFTNISLLNIQLTCNIRTFGQIDQNVYGIRIISGLPPEKPKNLNCIVNEGKKMMCQWAPGRETYLETNFTLKSEWATEKFDDCEAKRDTPTSCTVDYSPVYFVNIEVWVEAENALGKVTSDHINFDPIDKVKPNPPHNLSVSNSEELSSILKLTWIDSSIKTFIRLKYNIQYRTKDASTWSQIPPEDTASTRSSFTVQDLKPFTEYVFRIRCMKADGKGFWSDWSEEASGITYEDRPSKAPSFWYKIEPSHTHGHRSVRLIWKTLPPFQANGNILDYEVTLTRWKSRLQNYSVNDTELTVNLTNDRYIATLTARNLVGKSDASVLTIPACDFQATHPVKDLKAFPKDNVLWVEWTAPNESVNKYVLEWCVLSDKLPCNPDWQQEDGTVHRTYLRGNLAESKCYLIKVTPVYADGPGSPESVKAYLKQAPPSKGPTVRTKKVGKNEAVLEWDQLPVDVQNGFIRNYTIFYRTIIGNETAVNVDSSHTEYTLSSLTSDTLYMVRMAAYTDEGGKYGPEFTFTTPKFAQGEIEAIVVPVCLAFLLTTLLGVLFCFNKRDLIKKHIWPNVPDPSKSHIAQWSPHTPPRHNFNPKDQMYSDGNFTDVSVVEIEANDRKPFTEDLKSLELFKKEKISTEGHSSGIGGSSCMSSSRPSISSSDENESAQNTSSTVQYSTVVHSGYRHQVPSVQVFSRSESTQPLLDSEERPEDLQLVDNVEGSDGILPRQQYFKQNCSQHETSPVISHFERSKQGSSVNEEDFVRLKQQQISDHISQSNGSGQMKMFQEVPTANVFGLGTEGQVERFETVGMEAALDEGMPKSYLPQTVRQGGYMPQ